MSHVPHVDDSEWGMPCTPGTILIFIEYRAYFVFLGGWVLYVYIYIDTVFVGIDVHTYDVM